MPPSGAKAKWTKDGERNSKYFYALEKRNFNAKSISKLKINGETITQNDRILAEMRTFYNELYSQDGTISFQLQNTSNIKVNSEDRMNLNKPLSKNEFT